MTILLNGGEIPGYDHRVTITDQIERGDLSGETSSTAASHKGWKPAVIQVRCKVRMDKPLELAALRLLWHSTEEETGAPVVWAITEPTAEAMGIYKAQFSDFFKTTPQDQARLWDVSFTLIEVRSVPEKKAERLAESSEAEASAPAGSTTSDGEAAAANEDPATWLEDLLARVDKAVGKYVFGSEGDGS